jgi:hypothetical protein
MLRLAGIKHIAERLRRPITPVLFQMLRRLHDRNIAAF